MNPKIKFENSSKDKSNIKYPGIFQFKKNSYSYTIVGFETGQGFVIHSENKLKKVGEQSHFTFLNPDESGWTYLGPADITVKIAE